MTTKPAGGLSPPATGTGESLHFPLAQGWSRGLHFAFEDREASARIDRARYLHCKQTHGRELHAASPADLARAAQGPLAEADGLWAQGDWVRELKPRLLVRSADCVPLLMVDHKSQSVAAIHAGWRGLQKGIHRVPFEDLGAFDPKTTWLWIGPSLNGFEVGPDMYSQFTPAQQRDPTLFAPHPTAPEKRLFFSWNLIAQDYARFGVELVYNVEVDTLTTPAFASYRRAQKQGVELGQQNYSWLGFD